MSWPILNSQFFKDHPPKAEFFRPLAKAFTWSAEILPIYQWEEIIYVATNNPAAYANQPEWPLNWVLVEADTADLAVLWQNYHPKEVPTVAPLKAVPASKPGAAPPAPQKKSSGEAFSADQFLNDIAGTLDGDDGPIRVGVDEEEAEAHPQSEGSEEDSEDNSNDMIAGMFSEKTSPTQLNSLRTGTATAIPLTPATHVEASKTPTETRTPLNLRKATVATPPAPTEATPAPVTPSSAPKPSTPAAMKPAPGSPLAKSAPRQPPPPPIGLHKTPPPPPPGAARVIAPVVDEEPILETAEPSTAKPATPKPAAATVKPSAPSAPPAAAAPTKPAPPSTPKRATPPPPPGADRDFTNRTSTSIAIHVPKKPAPEFAAIAAEIGEIPLSYYTSLLATKAGNSVRICYWSDNLEAQPTEYDFSLGTPSPFRIALRTEKSYHGYTVETPFLSQLFKHWNNSVYPETFTVAPVIHETAVVGFVIALGNADAYTSESLTQIEQIANKLSRIWPKNTDAKAS